MKLGILSDTHGRADAARLAVEMLGARGAQMLVHCGDVGSEMVLDQMVGINSLFVFGNCDYDRDALRSYARILGVVCRETFGELEVDGRRIAVIHGDDFHIKRRILSEQQHDYLLQGHTHVREDVTIGRVRLINPGALYRANPRTAALLDAATGALEFIEVPAR